MNLGGLGDGAWAARPGEWLLEQRLGLARRMLESTDQTVEWMAHQAGFGSAATLRHHFAERLGTSPRAYRYTFCGAPAPTAAG